MAGHYPPPQINLSGRLTAQQLLNIISDFYKGNVTPDEISKLGGRVDTSMKRYQIAGVYNVFYGFVYDVDTGAFRVTLIERSSIPAHNNE